jgi:hypothetical protein
MPDNTLWQLQKAVYAALGGNAALAALLPAGAAAILDFVPPETAFPYIILGDVSTAPFSTAEGDGAEAFLTLETYSRGAGMKEIKLLTAAVHDALHDADLAVAGHHTVLCRNVSTDIARDGDGETRVARQRFHVILEPV